MFFYYESLIYVIFGYARARCAALILQHKINLVRIRNGKFTLCAVKVEIIDLIQFLGVWLKGRW